VLALMEVCVLPLRLGRVALAAEYGALLRSVPNLSIVDIHPAIALRAARLRAVERLAPADALHVAACIESGATTYVTNDKRLRRVRDIEVLVPDDFVTSS